MALTYMNPLAEIREQMDRIFSDFGEESRLPTMGRPESQSGRAGFAPPIEVNETDREIEVCAQLPGVNPEDVNVEVVGNTLVISGEYRRERKDGQAQIHRSEFQYGRYLRRIQLPDYIDPDQCEAEFNNGMLELRLPKREESRHKRIEIKNRKR